MPNFEKIKETLLNGMITDINRLIQDALDGGFSPQEILERGLITGMDVVGARFKNREIFLPEVLVSAKTMHAGMETLRPFLAKSGVKHSATIILGTVKGDLHDIGKKLVGMMLEGSGFEVLDIGIDQSSGKFVEIVKKKNPQVVGMSALLTTTMGEMSNVINALREAGLRENVKVIVGGAPISQQFADTIGADGYAPDAGSAVEKVRELLTNLT